MPSAPAKTLLVLLLLAFTFPPPAHAQPRVKPAQDGKVQPQPLTSRVILISISGLRADDLNESKTSKLRAPTLRGLRERGAHALNVESVYPSQTLPAHATLVTGMLPTDHGVTSDRAFDERGVKEAEALPRAGAIKTDTLWDAARRAGLKTAAVGFPLTAGAGVDFNSSPPAGAPASPSATLPEMKKEDGERALAATELLRRHRPQLLLLNFTSYARAAARFGPASAEAAEALENIDALLKRLLDAAEGEGLMGETTLLVVSDHGLMKVEREFRPNVVLSRKGLLKTDSQGRILSWRAVAQSFGGSAAIYLKDAQDEQAAREVEAALREVHEQADSPVWRLVTRKEAARLGADPRAVFYLDAAPGYVFSDAIRSDAAGKAEADTLRAAGGYLPQRIEMRAAFVAFGRAVKPGVKIEYARLIDVAPTVAYLLGFELRATRGRALAEIFTAPGQL
jgi:predicted AlkP superfamily pyrophosphatase or phosphodiesterase